MCKFESSQTEESRAQLTDSSKAYRKPGAFICQRIIVLYCAVSKMKTVQLYP